MIELYSFSKMDKLIVVSLSNFFGKPQQLPKFGKKSELYDTLKKLENLGR